MHVDQVRFGPLQFPHDPPIDAAIKDLTNLKSEAMLIAYLADRYPLKGVGAVNVLSKAWVDGENRTFVTPSQQAIARVHGGNPGPTHVARGEKVGDKEDSHDDFKQSVKDEATGGLSNEPSRARAANVTKMSNGAYM